MSKKNEVPARQKEFLETGAHLAVKFGIINVTRRAIAEAHSVTDPLVGKHVGGKADLQAGIKKTMKRLGLKEPDKSVIYDKGRELRARKEPVKVANGKTAAAKKVAKKSAPAKKPVATSSKVAKKAVAAKKSAPAKKQVAAKPSPVATAGKPARADKKVAAEPKRFKPKAPPLPALPNLGE